MSIPESVSGFLRKHPNGAYCDDCIQAQLGLKRRQQAQRVTGALEQTSEFARKKGICADCGKEKKTTSANEPPIDGDY